jgi:hypothetical protein
VEFGGPQTLGQYQSYTGAGASATQLTFSVASQITSSSTALCPDLLRFEQIGEADGIRGRIVRFFFHALHSLDKLLGIPWGMRW